MKTYTVLAEGWLTNARGHGMHYAPAAEGEKPVTIDLLPEQATYLLASGQIGEVQDESASSEAEPESAGERTGTELSPSGAASADPAAGVAGADITPPDPAATVIGTDGGDAGRTASRRRS
ncbi:hypothetical protein [Methylobacterium hispanicum]|uniref:hypothetical protein n=1 Tax=Methylobacterium hispanicum TaxID=270350 RepID=UPI002F341418